MYISHYGFWYHIANLLTGPIGDEEPLDNHYQAGYAYACGYVD